MDKFRIETSVQFPFFKMNELVTYSEVKKPSGIAYILLVLISESKNKTERLSKLLEIFGIPKSLHYIFADTIQFLIKQGILEDFDFRKNDFDNYVIGSFKFTSKGKKIFDEESIPTGINKEVKIPVFYNIALNEFSLKIDADLEPRPLHDSAITPEFINKFTCLKNVETYLNLQKGKGIGVKKEEVITQVKDIDKENWVARYDCVFDINGDELEVIFDDSVIQKFFNTYYTREILNNAISYKNKFKFKSAYKYSLEIGSYKPDKIIGLMIPKDIEDILKQKSQLFISKGNYKSSNGYMVVSEESIQTYDDNIEFIQIDAHDSIVGYIPANFVFKNEIFGEVLIPLVLKVNITHGELKELLHPYIKTLSSYSEDNFRELVKITNITNDFVLAENVLKGYLGNNVESNLVLLNEIKQTALLSAGILSIYKVLLEKNFYSYLDTITEDNLETFLKITSTIPSFLNIPANKVLASIIDKVHSQKNVELYEKLVNNGFDKSLVVLYVNPVDEALKYKNVEEKTLLDLINFDNSLNNLKKITGIDDYKNYIYDESIINHEDFKKSINNMFTLNKTIQVFKDKNEELFKKYNGFMKIFSSINDDINLMEAASKNINNITIDLISKKINSGEFQYVLVNLSAKLENLLKNKYKLHGVLKDMLDDSIKYRLINKEIVDDLQKFRDSRNILIHAEDRTIDFNANDLRRWTKEIFDLEDKK